MSVNERIEPLEIDGKKYYTVKQFAFMTDRSTATIYNLIGKGNAIRRLECRRIDNKPLIPVEELTDFPFISPGPGGKERPYYFDEHGNIAE